MPETLYHYFTAYFLTSQLLFWSPCHQDFTCIVIRLYVIRALKSVDINAWQYNLKSHPSRRRQYFARQTANSDMFLSFLLQPFNDPPLRCLLKLQIIWLTFFSSQGNNCWWHTFLLASPIALSLIRCAEIMEKGGEGGGLDNLNCRQHL